ncbi:MAG: hypothetical protein KDD61_04620 [Bdellovibrionales bacterium]|nr:hypothetical protein [Bdellovibrionales bacterium]
MAKIEIEVSEEIYSLFQQEPEYYQNLLREQLTKACRQRHRNPTDWVKTLTRLKTPVCNWTDLEQQILRGALGEQRD